MFARVHRVFGTKMRFLVTGGSKFDPAIGRDLYGMGFTLLNAYGLTETSGAATLMRPGDRFTTSVGQPLPGVEIRIAERAKPDEADDGEILIRGPVVMREYFERADATAESIKDGWLYTGDLGRLDADGRLYITGRKKEIIVLASGKNLYPEEIEAHYRQSPFIKELCVLGLSRPDEPAAERLHAVIVPDEQVFRERGIVNVRELIRFELEGLSVQLPAHKRILSYDIWLEPLPRTTTGKLKRPEIERRVRERATDARADARPLTDAERQWMAEPEHARLMATVERAARIARRIPPDANLELDLGLDSMERVELLTALERQCGTRVTPETRATIFTLRALIDAVLAAERSADEAGPADDTGSQPWDAVLRESPDPALVANLDRGRNARAMFAFVVLGLAGLAMRVLLRFRSSGQEHLPPTGPFIISPNHQSYPRRLRDRGGPALSHAPGRVSRRRRGVLRDAVLRVARAPGQHRARRSGREPRDGDASRRGRTPDEEGARALSRGRAIDRRRSQDVPQGRGDPLLAPRRADRAGRARWPVRSLAARAGRSTGAGWLPWRVTPVRVQFGAPIPVARGDYAGGTQALRDAVEKMLRGMRSKT